MLVSSLHWYWVTKIEIISMAWYESIQMSRHHFVPSRWSRRRCNRLAICWWSFCSSYATATTYPYHRRRLQWSPLSADLIATRQKIGCDRSVVGRTYSRVILMDVPFVGPSTDTQPGDLGHPQVTGRTLGRNPLACNVHSPNTMYIYCRRTRRRREWCVQWWHAEHRSLSEVRPICSCVFITCPVSHGWRTLPMPAAGVARSQCPVTILWRAMGFFRTERHLLFPYAFRTRACVPHVPKTALLFAGCHFFVIFFLKNYKLSFHDNLLSIFFIILERANCQKILPRFT